MLHNSLLHLPLMAAIQATHVPLVMTTSDQKKPMMISKFVSGDGGEEGARLKQGVIAQINGQKVLLVPKKKADPGTAPAASYRPPTQASGVPRHPVPAKPPTLQTRSTVPPTTTVRLAGLEPPGGRRSLVLHTGAATR